MTLLNAVVFPLFTSYLSEKPQSEGIDEGTKKDTPKEPVQPERDANGSGPKETPDVPPPADKPTEEPGATAPPEIPTTVFTPVEFFYSEPYKEFITATARQVAIGIVQQYEEERKAAESKKPESDSGASGDVVRRKTYLPPPAPPLPESAPGLLNPYAVSAMNLHTINAAQQSLIESLRHEVTVLREEVKHLRATESTGETNVQQMKEVLKDSMREILDRSCTEPPPKRTSSFAVPDEPARDVRPSASGTSNAPIFVDATNVPLGQKRASEDSLGAPDSKKPKDDGTVIKRESDSDTEMTAEELKEMKSPKSKKKHNSGSSTTGAPLKTSPALQPVDEAAVKQLSLAAAEKQQVIKKAQDFLVVKRKTNQMVTMLSNLGKLGRVSIANAAKKPDITSNNFFTVLHRELPELASDPDDLRQRFLDFMTQHGTSFIKVLNHFSNASLIYFFIAGFIRLL